ncbi:MAG: 1-deoxy-D-xylulose-5-phosphate synthase [Stygiobacter sp. RIFOXYC12_FULL_38_8]|nr:MAG: 1-deoxy-D-xylulose-5-phosphate synthase [Stygiobacter sp. GWC2_38_9]OGU77273.1 MAG: 1-deoxy-D-xylulose-5-phosphate synthase [Stygiobacter sp. RIFOXYA12_FULL_38_9]OGV08996.1 MAG: 1-deoxy-D-xylulose-5-phosphate synthase [Stygiobacter sp. RIFOXYB2_FULL_37_11]OGV14187.1 MAG: 1-deoxy-D-xylulose-5-phosphate synthase [Stygiobacter sp. RIFOXYA2_FULL_38_8]OGV16220.1 MAG: 1-deoxy-D-xylulose-5-phosphate synthase [Stygiobacter sp. RIFOXYC2_FULL_38_25]OGV25637.1 MAG: 1-deoxy-D-xylulose-5-phosphate 
MVDESKYQVLFKVNSPKDIRTLTVAELKTLCAEVREYMVDVISQVGGHFGGGLGTVELTVALHKVFDTPNDLIVWDTGHQAYPHKILTGRRDQLNTIRQLNGLSGFLKRSESEYDAFGAGHATTSVSAALGMAEGSKQQGTNKKVIAVIGDGAMTGGMAYEAMNNAGVKNSNLIVILNDNRMSIAPNVWQIHNYFNEMIAHPEYNKFKGAVWDLTGKLDQFGDRIRKVASRLERGIKSVITPGILFEALGFRYFGPINAHNLVQLIKIFEHIKNLNGPILVHVLSEKGKGYTPAEEHVQRYHAATPFDKVTGLAYKKSSSAPAYTTIFGKALVEIAKANEKVVGITAAMPDGTGMDHLQKEFPTRYYDVGIAEEHAVTFAAGLATQGVIPVVAIYSTFLQRGFDQIIHDVALQKLHVVFVLDRAGLVGADGPTHHGSFDLSYLRLIPGMVIMSPKDESELRDMLYTAVNYEKGPIAIRYPRGSALGVEVKDGFSKLEIGKAETLQTGKDVALLAVGNMVEYSKAVAEQLSAEGLSAEVVNMRFVKPLDSDLLDSVSKRFTKIVTLEESTIVGGFGSAVLEYFAEKNYKNDILRIALPDNFVDHGTQEELHKIIGIDPEGIFEKVKALIHSK